MLEFLVFLSGIAAMYLGYLTAYWGIEFTRRRWLFGIGWAFIIVGSVVAQGAVFYAMWR